ncbi:hypothetical protein Taro_026903 [Colocasia esculenta]|uniref:Uncharacterized protein n=1 Tax=Colocasia esculenta TaxID=4460 RepID=A0A843VIH6_COLES|nr:hypothetical protein [Colocasia esculenta]
MYVYKYRGLSWPSLVVWFLFRNTSTVRYPRFCVSQELVFVVLGVCLGTCVVPSRSMSYVLDTLTPVFELYVRLRERRQRAVCPGVGTVVVVVCERRLTGCGLTHVVCPVVGTVVSRSTEIAGVEPAGNARTGRLLGEELFCTVELVRLRAKHRWRHGGLVMDGAGWPDLFWRRPGADAQG